MAGVLITGAAGMVGSHLFEALRRDRVPGVVATFHAPTIPLDDLAEAALLVPLDVRDPDELRRIVAAHRPATIFHLAAQSLPGVSWQHPRATMDVNAGGTINLFEAVRHVRTRDAAGNAAYDPMVVVACSSAEYGDSLAASDAPVTEDAPLLPLHPYGVSKVAQDLTAFQYWRNWGIRCIRARIFNCTGPRKQGDVVSDFARRVAAILHRGGTLRVGNLNARRAILDVADLVRALRVLAERGEPGAAYNISAAAACAVGDLVPMFEHLAGLHLELQVDAGLLRPSDEQLIVGCTDRLHAATGWQPRVPLAETVRAVFDYERARAAREPAPG